MFDIITGQVLDLQMLKTRFGQMVRVGPVAEIDAAKGYRIKLADTEDGPLLSPWLPHPESGGQSSSWMPLSIGQVVGILSPNGDIRQGVLLRGGFTDGNQPPSADLAANVLKAFGITITMKDGEVKIEGDVTIKGDVKIEGDQEVSGDVDFTEGHVQHNGIDIGDTHVHGGVVPGGADTQGPH
ncbi:baseplate assembly protein [Roseibium salinum]|uniref:Baseplate assembly protein n=1 Tax=Roseibium salinum TaxID=1604349 RepID=A0ABT3R055_9HYPH|nr:baseplate assembly protein [Roseibium sp. DSM 29163]MCX2722610.1 baseplate assembly protein [Roseibium sp. DSM 29163]MDN3719429.1 baseplate assembly protein [Roseibium salinum]